MIVVIEVIKAVQGKSGELKKAIHDIVPLCQKEEGCLQYELFEPTKENGEFLVLQKWKNPKDLARHETSKTIEEFIRKYDGVLYVEVTQYTEWKPVV